MKQLKMKHAHAIVCTHGNIIIVEQQNLYLYVYNKMELIENKLNTFFFYWKEMEIFLGSNRRNSIISMHQ